MTARNNRFIAGCLLSLTCFISLTSAHAAGPAGHFLLGKKIIADIQTGRCTVDPDLTYILKHEDARRAFEGGCIGPDVAEEKTHYNNTAALADKMLNEARANYKTAAAAKDQAALDKARQELAFAFGWYSHCATDLNVHQKVNSFTGDTFRFNNLKNQAVHGIQESQLTSYLKEKYGNAKFDVYVPLEFLSKQLGVPVANLKSGEAKLKTKVITELALANQVKMSQQIRDSWKDVVDRSISDSESFLQNQSAMKNWDLDCGRMTTDEFNQLRRLAIKANGGTRPADWGKKYPFWYEKTKGLSEAEKLDLLKQLIGGQTSVATTAKSQTKSAASNTTYAWVLVETKEFPIVEANYQCTGANGNYTLTWDSHGCSTPGCPGEKLSVHYVCSQPPKVIKADEKITLDLSGSIDCNTIQHYSCNTNVDVFFDRPEIDPGSYGGGPGLGGLKIGGRDKTAPPAIKIQGAPGHSYESAGKVALIVANYNGRSAGTKYIFQWQKLP